MKFLIINELVKFGGTESQIQKEIRCFKYYGYEIYLLTFDNNFPNGYIDKYHYNLRVKKGILYKIYNKFFKNRRVAKKINKIIQEINPDYIHLNNIISVPRTVYSVVKNYKTIQTLRDYTAVCPKSTCIKPDCAECAGFKTGRCVQCIKGPFKKLRLLCFKKILDLKQKASSCFVCPSEALTRKCIQNEYKNVVCINDLFDFSNFEHVEKIKTSEKIYLYYGSISEIKGIFQLIDAFDEFSKDKLDVKLYFVGKINSTDQAKFEKVISTNSKIIYKGYKNFEEIIELFKSIYCTVVPSLWIENYPNTVMESMAYKTLVIGSNRGGMVEMIENYKLLFNILDKKNFVNVLNYTYSMTDEEYMQIVNLNYEKVKSRNSESTYFNRLLEVYSF